MARIHGTAILPVYRMAAEWFHASHATESFNQHLEGAVAFLVELLMFARRCCTGALAAKGGGEGAYPVR